MKIHPVLFPPFVEFAPAYHVSVEGVASLFEIERYSTSITPPPVLSIAHFPDDPTALRASVIRFPEEPLIVKSETVVVVSTGN